MNLMKINLYVICCHWHLSIALSNKSVFIESCGEQKPFSDFRQVQFMQSCMCISQDVSETQTAKVMLAQKFNKNKHIYTYL